MNIIDLKVYVKNEELYTRILHAEIKYFSVMYPFLMNSQIRGKALTAMGIVHISEKMPIVSKLLPFYYKRKIKKPKDQWSCNFINKTFQPVITLAEKRSCVKENSGLPVENERPITNKFFKCRNVYESFEEDTFNNDSSQMNPSDKSFDENLIDADIEMIMENSTPPKSSESQAKIMWPFQSLNNLPKKSSTSKILLQATTRRVLKHSHSTKIISIKKDNIVVTKQKITNIKENEVVDKLNEEELAVSNKENYMLQKKAISKQHTSTKNPYFEKTGYLTDIFTPATRQGCFPKSLMPVVIRSSTSSQDN